MTEEERLEFCYSEHEKMALGESVDTVTNYVREGDVNTTLHSPFEIFPENISKPLRENRRIMHVVLMSPDEVFEKWGAIESGTDNRTYKIMKSENYNYGGGAMSGRATGTYMGVATIRNSVMVYEEHELPSPRYLNGRLIICTDNHLLHYGPLPDNYGENGEFEFCFNVQQSLKTDGFFGRSVVERMIPFQRKYNDVKNRKQDYINRVAIGVLAAEEGALVDEDYFRNNGIAPGDILLYRQGTSRMPSFLSNETLPQTVENEESELLSGFNRMSGVSQLAQQSVTPTNVVSGIAIAGLAEQDDTRIGLEAENIKNCLTDIGRKWLVLYSGHVKYSRAVKDIGRNDEFEISQFIGNDLTSFDVFIETEPEASDTLSQRRQKVVELLNGGLFNDPKTGNITNEGRIKVFELLELGNWEDFVDADDAQMRKADRENNAMVIGKPAIIRPFDDDIIHISKHNNFRLFAEYEEALERNPEIDQIFENHVNEHLSNLQVKTMNEQQGMGAEPGISINQLDVTEEEE